MCEEGPYSSFKRHQNSLLSQEETVVISVTAASPSATEFLWSYNTQVVCSPQRGGQVEINQHAPKHRKVINKLILGQNNRGCYQ